jgi:putative peptidoglycan lipid II flippase
MTKNHYNWKIFNAASLVALVSIAAKLFSALKDLIVAASFGTGIYVDAFILAALLPLLSVSVFSLPYALALVPVVTKVSMRDGVANGFLVFERYLFKFILILLLLSVALFLCAEPLSQFLVSDSLDLQKQVANSLLILSPLILIAGISQLLISMLNAQELFALPALTQICSPFFMIVALFILPDGLDSVVLPLGALVGNLFQLFILFILYIIKRVPSTVKKEIEFSHFSAIIRSAWVPLFISALLMSTTELVDQIMASHLGVGEVATLNYGTRVVAALVSIIAGALTSAAFPYISQMIERAEITHLRQTLFTYTRLIIFAASIGALLLAILSEPIIRILFERGMFGPLETAKVTLVQQFALIQLPFYLLNALYIRVIMALRINWVLSVVTLISIILNILLNILFSLRFGVAGIALSTSCVYLWSALALGFVIYRAQKSTKI